MSSNAQIKIILQNARNLLTPEGAWIQGAFAADFNGENVLPSDKRAVCWCALGAIAREIGDQYSEALRVFREYLDELSITEWNDYPYRTKEQVLNTFDKVIASIFTEE